MASWINVDLPDGLKGGGLSDFNGPWLVLHVDALALTDEELGRAARACADAAWYAEALNCADWIVCNNRDRKLWMINAEIVNHKMLLLPHKGKSADIDQALALIEQVELYQQHRAAKPAMRFDIQRDYDRLFVKIGRRDGFRCKRCGSSDDLAIDHVKALAVGGTNDLDNLQLLCRSCNSSKGARE